ncbi:MAG: DinB family protein, partial [Anaerolineae bacterium]|nr:DinB family protein [Anaerolineae bacterium]
MSDLLDRVREKHLILMHRTLLLITNIVEATPAEAMTRYTDGEGGWAVVEVLGHLLDANEYFTGRARRILTEDNPHLEVFQHEQMVIANGYRQQVPEAVLARLNDSRQKTLAFFEDLTQEQWERAGVHPEYGDWTMTDALMQIGHHEVNHLEQITRILSQATT